MSQPRDPANYQSVLGKCLAATGSMQGLVEKLLLLARADAQQVPVDRSEFDVVDLLRRNWGAFEERARSRCLEVRWEVNGGVPLASDRDKMSIVLTNLLDNAVSYADEQGWIQISAQRKGAGAEVSIANSGSHLLAGDENRICERFWRGDAARSDGQHCGLGLSLSQKLLEVLQGRLEIEAQSGGVFQATAWVSDLDA